MGLSHEHVGPKILAKIKIYLLTRAEFIFPLFYEIPCTWILDIAHNSTSSILRPLQTDHFHLLKN